MSDTLAFDRRYSLPALVSNVEVADFQLDVFPRADDAEPLPDPTADFTPEDLGPPPNPFAEFQVGRQKLSELLTPSLDGLFKPFDLTLNRPMAEFVNLAEPAAPGLYDYEDMDTRDDGVIRTLVQAKAKGREMLQEAQAEGFAITEAARTEARGLVAEARAMAGAEAEVYGEGLRRQAESVLSEAEIRRGEAEDLKIAAERELAAAEDELAAAERDRAAAEEERSAAEKERAGVATRLAEAEARIAGLDQERREMEAAVEKRRQELEAHYQELQAELAARRGETLAEGRATGQREGYEKGLAEGRAAGQAETAGLWRDKTGQLAGLLERLENLYQDLWRANGPMMIQLAIEAAEGILNKELKSAEDLTVRAFEACIGFLGQAHRVVFQARPQDIPLLEEARAEQRQRLGALVKVTFQPDERLGPGDLIMESDIGRLDATVKHRAAQVLPVLKEAFENAQAFPRPEAGPRPTAEPGPAEVLAEGQESGEPEPSGQAEPQALQDSLNGQAAGGGPEPAGQAEPLTLEDSLEGQAPAGPEPSEGSPGVGPA